MKAGTKQIFDTYCNKYDFIDMIKGSIITAFECLVDSFLNGNKLLVCGNGGSCSDADHIAGELMKGFLRKRQLKNADALLDFGEEGEYLLKNLQGGLPVVNLGANMSLVTAVMNDMDGKLIFAQQVYALGKKGDVLLGISTSGNSLDVLYAGMAAKIMGIKVIGLTGQQGGKIAGLTECAMMAPSNCTPDIQNMHTVIYHLLCAAIENEFWDI